MHWLLIKNEERSEGIHGCYTWNVQVERSFETSVNLWTSLWCQKFSCSPSAAAATAAIFRGSSNNEYRTQLYHNIFRNYLKPSDGTERGTGFCLVPQCTLPALIGLCLCTKRPGPYIAHSCFCGADDAVIVKSNCPNQIPKVYIRCTGRVKAIICISNLLLLTGPALTQSQSG